MAIKKRQKRNAKKRKLTRLPKEVVAALPMLWPFCDEGLRGFKDINGDVVIPARYESVRGFHCGLAAVQMNGKWGFVDMHARMVVSPEYDAVCDFVNGKTSVRRGADEIYIDRRGRKIRSRRNPNARPTQVDWSRLTGFGIKP